MVQQLDDEPIVTRKFRELIKARTGISLNPSKRQLIQQRLRSRVRAWEMTDTAEYLEMLMTAPGMQDEMQVVIDLITTNTTSFFREAEHFDYLVREILPMRIGASSRRNRYKFKLWSAAASEGVEAYTAAMVLHEQAKIRKDFDFEILGTDISQRILRRAASAIYEADQFKSVPNRLQHYGMQGNTPEFLDKVRIVPELRKTVTFRALNLMDAQYSGITHDYDVILLRNVLIYFDPEGKAAVVDRLARHLAPGAFLIVGHSESMVVRHPDLKQVKATIFRKER